MLEFCDRGNLQDLVDRGGFNRLRNELGKGYSPDPEFVRCVASACGISVWQRSTVQCSGSAALQHGNRKGPNRMRNGWARATPLTPTLCGE